MSQKHLSAGGRVRADVALVFIALIWGATFVVVKQALDHVSTLLFLTLRFSLATVALALVFRPLSPKLRGGKSFLLGGVLSGALLFSGYMFQTFGLKHTTASKSAFITGLSIVLVPLMSAAFERKLPRAAEWIGIAVATTGMGLMTLQGAEMSIGRGDVLTLLCAFGFGAHIVAVGHYAPRFSFGGFSLVQIATAAALSLGSFWWAETAFVAWRPDVVIAIAVTGILATALAFGAQAWAQQYTTPTRTALIFATEPVFAWFTSYLAAGELLSARASAGAALILAGILLVELKPASRGQHQPVQSQVDAKSR